MTRIQEPDLLIDHDSGGHGCKRFLGGPVVEPFVFSGAHKGSGGVASHKLKSGGLAGKWFPFPSNPTVSPKKPHRTSSKGETMSFPSQEKPVVVVHTNNNNNIILDMLDENTRWSSAQASGKHATSPGILPPPSNTNGLLISTTKPNRTSLSNPSNKSTKPSKNNNCNNQLSHSNKKNNCNSINSNSNSSVASKSQSRVNNCSSPVVTSASTPHISSSQFQSGGDDDESGGRHLIIRYIHCNERPNKKQLVTLGLISLVFLVVLVVLLAVFLAPASTRSIMGGSSSSSLTKDSTLSDSIIPSDIPSSLSTDEGDVDDSGYDDGEDPFYSSTPSSSGLDLKKVSKLSWDLLNSNQDAMSRGLSNDRGASLPPLQSVSTGAEGEIILPAKMIYTSSGDSADLRPSEHSTGGGSSGKKRSCCRTQKYSQVIKRDGCEPLTIVNKMCFGQCVSVWVPGLFASFPVCRPSKSTFKTVTLTCGRNREKRKRVRIEKVRRCSCMEIEPTAASL